MRREKQTSTTAEDQSNKDYDHRRKRIERLKTIIIIIAILFLIMPTIFCIILGIQVNRLQKQMKELIDIHSQYGLTYEEQSSIYCAYAAEKYTDTLGMDLLDLANRAESTIASSIIPKYSIVPTKTPAANPLSGSDNELSIYYSSITDYASGLTNSSTLGTKYNSDHTSTTENSTTSDNTSTTDNTASSYNGAFSNNASTSDNSGSSYYTSTTDNAESSYNTSTTDNAASSYNTSTTDNAGSLDNTSTTDNATSSDHTLTPDNTGSSNDTGSSNTKSTTDNTVSSDYTVTTDNAASSNNTLSTKNNSSSANTSTINTAPSSYNNTSTTDNIPSSDNTPSTNHTSTAKVPSKPAVTGIAADNNNDPSSDTDRNKGTQPANSEEKEGVYKGKKVYLTFDDGPSIYTDDILDILADYNVKATFFVVGKTDKESKRLYKRIVKEGHTLGMHSYSHNYEKIYNSLEDFDKDFTKLWKLLYDTTGYKPTIYRFPGGSENTVNKNGMDDFIQYLNDASMVYYDWNVVNGDATGVTYTKEQLIANVLGGVAAKKRSIVLMHDTQSKKKTVESLPSLLEELIAGGAQILPLDNDVPPIQMIKADSVN